MNFDVGVANTVFCIVSKSKVFFSHRMQCVAVQCDGWTNQTQTALEYTEKIANRSTFDHV